MFLWFRFESTCHEFGARLCKRKPQGKAAFLDPSLGMRGGCRERTKREAVPVNHKNTNFWADVLTTFLLHVWQRYVFVLSYPQTQRRILRKSPFRQRVGQSHNPDESVMQTRDTSIHIHHLASQRESYPRRRNSGYRNRNAISRQGWEAATDCYRRPTRSVLAKVRRF